MAKDVIEIVDHLGWTAERELNVVGISMGGMIAQEIVSARTFHPLLRPSSLKATTAKQMYQACLIPTRLNSLILLSTAARIVNTVGWVENLRSRINLFIPKVIMFVFSIDCFNITLWHRTSIRNSNSQNRSYTAPNTSIHQITRNTSYSLFLQM